jgi:hypothetical protein
MELFLDVDPNAFTMTERAMQGFALLIFLAISWFFFWCFYKRKMLIHFVWRFTRRPKGKRREDIEGTPKKETKQPELLSDYFDETGERHGSNIFTSKSNDKN